MSDELNNKSMDEIFAEFIEDPKLVREKQVEDANNVEPGVSKNLKNILVVEETIYEDSYQKSCRIIKAENVVGFDSKKKYSSRQSILKQPKISKTPYILSYN